VCAEGRAATLGHARFVVFNDCGALQSICHVEFVCLRPESLQNVVFERVVCCVRTRYLVVFERVI
jgi:hypothetical protein